MTHTTMQPLTLAELDQVDGGLAGAAARAAVKAAATGLAAIGVYELLDAIF
jgi:hypothetical protein